MFKIGDFARLGQVSSRMLRHYDQLGLLTPKHTDRWTGYRYYTIDQLGQLNRIIALKELGLTLEQIGDLMADDDQVSAERLRGMLTLKRAEIARTLQEEQSRLARVEARLRQIELEDQPSPYEVVVKAIPAMPVASIRQVVPTIDEMDYFCRALYGQLYARLGRHGITPLQPEITLYHNDEYSETDLDVEVAVPVHPKHVTLPSADENILFHRLPGYDLAAALIYEGTFPGVTDGVLALLRWVGLNDHVLAGPMRELHISGRAHKEGKTQPEAVLELQVPVRRVQRAESET
jgi:DNA-binding transcriptional MerR regulator